MLNEFVDQKQPTLTLDKGMIDAISYQAIKNTIQNGSGNVKQEHLLHQTVGIITLSESLKMLIDMVNTESEAENSNGNGDSGETAEQNG